MNQIEQTTLTIQDITEHHKLLEHGAAALYRRIDLFLPADRKQEVTDEMVMRFIRTFMILED